MLTAPIAAALNGSNEIIAAPPAGYKFRVIAFVLSFSGTVNAKFQSASTDLSGLIYGILGTQSPSPTLPRSIAGPMPQFTTAPGEALNLNLSGATAVGGFVAYEKIPASM